jgi:hypothetical protein
VAEVRHSAECSPSRSRRLPRRKRPRFGSLGLALLASLCALAIFATSALAAPVNGEKACAPFKLKGPNNCNAPLTSGVTIMSESGGICTAGPLAIPSNEPAKKEKTYLLTAGHCIANGATEGEEYESESQRYPGGRPGAPRELANPNCEAGRIEGGKPVEPWKGERWFAFNKAGVGIEIGRAGSYAYTNTDDYGQICITNPAWASGEKNRPFWAVTAEWNKPEERFLVKGQKEPALKETVCHEGQTTGHSCGTITLAPVPGTSFIKAEGGGVFSEPGDSGGPWYYLEANLEVLMEGIHSHVVIGQTAINQPRYYENLKPALAGLGKLNGFGMELLTTKNEVR